MRQAEETTKAAAVHEAASRSPERAQRQCQALAAARVELEQMRGEEQEAVKTAIKLGSAKAEAAARATAEAAKQAWSGAKSCRRAVGKTRGAHR